MFGAARVGDVACGGVILVGSSDVYVNGSSATMQSCVHSCCIHAAGAVLTGSSSVVVNGLPMARMGDVAGCGGVVSTGSCDVFVG